MSAVSGSGDRLSQIVSYVQLVVSMLSLNRAFFSLILSILDHQTATLPSTRKDRPFEVGVLRSRFDKVSFTRLIEPFVCCNITNILYIAGQS